MCQQTVRCDVNRFRFRCHISSVVSYRVTKYQTKFPLAEAETSLNLHAISKLFHLMYKIYVMASLFGIQKKLGTQFQQPERMEMEKFKRLQNGWV